MNINQNRAFAPNLAAPRQFGGTENKSAVAADTFASGGQTSQLAKGSDVRSASLGTSFQPLPATPGDVEGPYYRANAPVRNNLFVEGEQGAPVKYTIEVVDVLGRAIPGATVDIWTADAEGLYDMTSQDFRGRAQTQTDAGGQSKFEGVRPGNYDLGTDPETGEKIYRPAHVHGKFSAPGFKGVTGQLYFPDDPYNESDPIIDREEGERGFDPALVMSGENNDFTFRWVLGRE